MSRFKIDPEVKEKVRELAKQGVLLKHIAIRFGLGRGTVSRIVNGKQ